MTPRSSALPRPCWRGRSAHLRGRVAASRVTNLSGQRTKGVDTRPSDPRPMPRLDRSPMSESPGPGARRVATADRTEGGWKEAVHVAPTAVLDRREGHDQSSGVTSGWEKAHEGRSPD